jgi:hypothetical protein
MLKAPKLLLTIFALLSACVAVAQDSFDFKFAKMEILQLKPVQKELGITEAQRAAMNGFANKHRSRVAEYEKQLKAAGKGPQNLTEADQKKLFEFYSDLRRDVYSQLSAKQLKRLREITFQLADLSPLMDAEIAKRVGMSDAQLKKFREAFRVGAQQSAALQKQTAEPILKPYQGVKPKDQKDAERLNKEVNAKLQAAGKRIEPRMKQIRDTTRAKMLAILTPAQKKAWATLQGAKFDVSKLK